MTEISDGDLRVETWPRMAVPGWRVRDLDAAVVVTHVPTGLSASCSEHRSQILNKAAAMRALRKLLPAAGTPVVVPRTDFDRPTGNPQAEVRRGTKKRGRMTMLDAMAKALDAGAEAVRFRPSGNSMMPRIRHKELVTVYQIPDKTRLRPGDIVLAKVRGVTRLHQILAVDHPNNRVETGNMRRHSDGYVAYHAIHGIRLTVEQASACAERESARNAQEAARATLADARA